MSWIKECKDCLIGVAQAAGLISTQEERATDIQVHIEQNNKKIVELKKDQKLMWGKAAVELREMGVTQEDFDLLNSIDPLGTTVLPISKATKAPKANSAKYESKFEHVRTENPDADGLAS